MNLYEFESIGRIVPFLSGLFLFSVLGFILPYRKQEFLPIRFLSNISLTFINSGLSKILFPLSLGAVSIKVVQYHWGLFQWMELHTVTNIILTIVILDFVIYWQHRFFHQWKWLWSLHRVHHTDTLIDASTALRFHPLENIISNLIQVAFIIILGANFWGVLAFSIILNFSALFNHGNFSLPTKLEKILVRLIVTPDMHRVHHSVIKSETNSNYGFFLSLWGRIFYSYTAKPMGNPQTMEIGIEIFRTNKDNRLDQLLIQPFKRSSL